MQFSQENWYVMESFINKIEGSKWLLLKSVCIIPQSNIKTLLKFCHTTASCFFYKSRVFESRDILCRCVLYCKSFPIKNNFIFTLQFLLNFLIFDKILTNFMFISLEMFVIHWNSCTSSLVEIFYEAINFYHSNTKRTFIFLVYVYTEQLLNSVYDIR